MEHMKPYKMSTIKWRIMKNVRIEGDCWIWIGATDAHGYGRMNRNGIRHTASRMSLWVFKGGFDLENKAIDICHNHILCNNPRICVKPEHLYIGTRSENIQDAVREGTHRSGFSR
jgi:hypothetical protein